MINKKIKNTYESIDISENINELNGFSTNIKRVIKSNNDFIEKVNNKILNQDKEKLSIKKNICLVVINELIYESSELIKKYGNYIQFYTNCF
ncbi:MAG: hypothetical protein IIT97_03395 [Mycoplasmataceae bacterium]|nr:hypothetical protein [Mycoplasmataceae bacterium]